MLAPQLEALVKEHPTAKLRMIDIDDWSSDVARQHRIDKIPHLVLFENGRPTISGRDAVLDALRQ